MAEQWSGLGNFAANFSQYIVRPLNAFGIGGFVFDNEGETTVNLATEITDHFVEDATTIQDHIAVKPKKVTLKSYVGELVYRQDDSTDTFVQKAVQKLTTVNQFLPTMTSMAQQVLDIRDSDLKFDLNSISNAINSKTINRVTDYWSFIKNMAGGLESRQQQAYTYFKALMEQKMLVSVQTPFEYMNRMAIETITAVQPEGSKYISDFTITLKEIRTAELLASPTKRYTTQEGQYNTSDPLQGRAMTQNADNTNLGGVQGIDMKRIDDARIRNTLLQNNVYRIDGKPVTLPSFDTIDPTKYSIPAAAIDDLPLIQKTKGEFD